MRIVPPETTMLAPDSSGRSLLVNSWPTNDDNLFSSAGAATAKIIIKACRFSYRFGKLKSLR